MGPNFRRWWCNSAQKKKDVAAPQKFKNTNGWRTHNDSNLLITIQMPNYSINEMKRREKIKSNSPTTTTENVQDVEQPIQKNIPGQETETREAHPCDQ